MIQYNQADSTPETAGAAGPTATQAGWLRHVVVFLKHMMQLGSRLVQQEPICESPELVKVNWTLQVVG